MTIKTRTDKPPRSTLSKGMLTRASILETAHTVFKSTGYYGSSVSEITRQANVSMGTFYQYFKNKEQLFIELTDLIVSRFIERTEAHDTSEATFEKRLQHIIALSLQHTRENFAFHRILGESELVDRVTIGYYESIARYFRKFFRRETQAGNIKPLDPNLIAYGLIGICDFIAMDWGEDEGQYVPEQATAWICDVLLKGISGPAPWSKHPGWDHLTLPDPAPLYFGDEKPATKGQRTRHLIFQAAEKMFGKHGVNRANISDITREAGVAQGTFYIHFDSKNDLVEGFVRDLNHNLRKEVQRILGGRLDRRDAEWMGMLAFYNFLCHHRAIYRVVPEFEIIGHELGLWYYKKLAKGYAHRLEQAIERQEIRPLPAVFLTRYLMGFTHFIGLKWIVWGNAAQQDISGPLFRDIREFILFGLAK